MIGVDNSEEMLELALEKKEQSGKDILYLCQDMREFELYGTVAAVVSICDCMNYILEPEDLTEVFRLVNNYLDPGGVFIFDMNTEYKYREIMADNTIAEDRTIPALSGTTSMRKRKGSIFMICPSLSVKRGAFFEMYHGDPLPAGIYSGGYEACHRGGRNGICCCLRRVHEESAAGGQ